MATWRDLAMPRSKEVWRELRGLRTAVGGPVRHDMDRRNVFVSSLEQAQQFTEAAVGAGAATRPVQIFYALSQFGRAIAASSGLLGKGEWRLTGHGIQTRNIDASQGLARVAVTPTAKGSFPGVARALGVQPMEAQRSVSLGELWPLIPEAQKVPLPDSSGLPALYFSPGGLVYRGEDRWCRLSLSPVPQDVKVRSQVDPLSVDVFLSRYPSMSGWSHTPDAPDSIQWRLQDSGANELVVFLPSGLDVHARDADGRREALERATFYRGPSDSYVFPEIGDMGGPVHPLLAWWAILFGLSILTRYEPESWAGIIDIDDSSAANAVEHLLEEAIVVIPHLALRAINDVSVC
ncbi:YaaC family protein [Streptomyces sp. NPDC052020]|uniref:YaaC family protein n=1 Tax=Streptomyces sp. NPDC052020 TaxID=3155677 RepID=UPI0034352355